MCTLTQIDVYFDPRKCVLWPKETCTLTQNITCRNYRFHALISSIIKSIKSLIYLFIYYLYTQKCVYFKNKTYYRTGQKRGQRPLLLSMPHRYSAMRCKSLTGLTISPRRRTLRVRLHLLVGVSPTGSVHCFHQVKSDAKLARFC